MKKKPRVIGNLFIWNKINLFLKDKISEDDSLELANQIYDAIKKESIKWKYYCGNCDVDFNKDEKHEHIGHQISKNPVTKNSKFNKLK